MSCLAFLEIAWRVSTPYRANLMPLAAQHLQVADHETREVPQTSQLVWHVREILATWVVTFGSLLSSERDGLLVARQTLYVLEKNHEY